MWTIIPAIIYNNYENRDCTRVDTAGTGVFDPDLKNGFKIELMLVFVDYDIIITKHNIIYLPVQTRVLLNTIISNLMNHTIIIRRQTIITHRINDNSGVVRYIFSISASITHVVIYYIKYRWLVITYKLITLLALVFW